ncbi:hypothetical protein B4102_3618 [Heyndrickxia sporothermodurans]|uniref:Uncharacterized protein n=1 Tax=Heyndrickxia sporothermodurans TaxID=46224 RepID=A0A150KL75_9BACI|nr:hypothetical protein B4102_3618 [Heyndrickxia sporothermodurans]
MPFGMLTFLLKQGIDVLFKDNKLSGGFPVILQNRARFGGFKRRFSD